MVYSTGETMMGQITDMLFSMTLEPHCLLCHTGHPLQKFRILASRQTAECAGRLLKRVGCLAESARCIGRIASFAAVGC